MIYLGVFCGVFGSFYSTLSVPAVICLVWVRCRVTTLLLINSLGVQIVDNF